MTEKRFIIYTDQIDHWTIGGLDLLQEHTGRRLIVEDIENILNELYNENEELKKILKFLRNDNATDILNVLNSQENQIWELKKENEKLKQPNCRNCIHFSCDNADIYCMEKEYESIPDCSIAKDCDEYVGLYG